MTDTNLADELALIRDEISNGNDLTALKNELKPLAEKLKTMLLAKKELELQQKEALSAANKAIIEQENKIRTIWEPLVHSDKSDLDLDGIKLTLERKLNVSTEDKELAIAWLEANDHKDVMKWDIHPSTLKSLATELFAEGTEIDGLKYSSFPLIKVK